MFMFIYALIANMVVYGDPMLDTAATILYMDVQDCLLWAAFELPMAIGLTILLVKTIKERRLLNKA